MIRLVLFSQDRNLQRVLASALDCEYDVATESNPRLLRQALDNPSSDLLLLDLDAQIFPSEAYIRLFEEIVPSGVAVVLMVDEAARSTAIELVNRGAHSYCRKPPALQELRALLRPAHQHAVMKRTLNSKGSLTVPVETVPACDALIGSSAPMRQVYDLIHRVANLRASVLITGETGTGKELIARAIHNLGGRKNQPFVGVSCGAVPETLIESELFGHEKGAFTGTTGTRVGYFEQAAGGTLFLDEIGELSPQTQVKLLRVLQQREFARVGSSSPLPLTARVIFATHRDLPRLIEEGKFRLDLYYRLNVMTIHSPSLAERPEDIGFLAGHFLSRYADLYGKHVTAISPAALTALEDYEWPGNVRELENVIQRAIICADSRELQLSNLPPQMHAPPNLVSMEDIRPVGTFERRLRDYKLQLARQAVEDCHGNKTLAARSLDLSRAYLHQLLRQSEGVGAFSAASSNCTGGVRHPAIARNGSSHLDVLSVSRKSGSR
jgi:DNA-binding NtrC family response regulator